MAEFTYGINVDRERRMAKDLTDLIGNTPLLRLDRFSKKNDAGAHSIIGKLEYFNPLSSVKDRAALSIIEEAERSGALKEGGTIIEATSGNMGIGLAYIAAIKGYRMILTMPESMSIERRRLLSALGAELVLTPAQDGMAGSVRRANELAQEIDGAFVAGQFENPANPQAHRVSTAQEILRDTYGLVDVFIAGIGSGGTITGVGEVLKAFNKNIKIIAVEPAESPLLSEGKAGAHGIMGIGANFVPDILNRDVIDEIIPVRTSDAYDAARSVAKTEGLLVGISSGAALWAALKYAKSDNGKAKNIVAMLPDSGERYLSTALYE